MLKPTHKIIKQYYLDRERISGQGVQHELAIRPAFFTLLDNAARAYKMTLLSESSFVSRAGKRIIPDGTIKDEFRITKGYWEAKDSADNLSKEIQIKISKGYPLTNIIFEDGNSAVLIQDRTEVMRIDLNIPEQLAVLINKFFEWTEPPIENFHKAVEEFRDRVKELGAGLNDIIIKAHIDNYEFKEAFDNFYNICRGSLNPNIRREAVDEMIIQHLLTERVIRKVFDNADFMQRNVIAREVESVIAALVKKSLNRDLFLRSLDRFYFAIEEAAHQIKDYDEKQQFINTVYERFFQGFAVKVADTHGIVYTPQPVVEFMVNSVQAVLEKEFGKQLGDVGINILDPATGTGSFIVKIIEKMSGKDVKRVYTEQLFANEVMLMPYYIASLNIEHAYYEKTGVYEPFEGLCFVDTLDLIKGKQTDFILTEANTERIQKERNAQITVIIGNPPYNVGQQNENDNNKNRAYKFIEDRIKNTYVKDSKATNKNALYDAYVKFFRWATDRLNGRDGIVCFISNNNFVDSIAFEGVRKNLLDDFNTIYHLDLHGNVRKNEKISGTSHNVFGIQVGVGITVAVRMQEKKAKKILYYRVPEFWRREEKYDFLDNNSSITKIEWEELTPSEKNIWIHPQNIGQYEKLISIGNKKARQSKNTNSETTFINYSRGIVSCRDSFAYDFSKDKLIKKIIDLAENYNAEVDRYKRSGKVDDIDYFVKYEKIKWSRDLKQDLRRKRYAEYDEGKIRNCHYRPFTKKHLYLDRILNEEVYNFPEFFPALQMEKENIIICVSGIGSNRPFQALAANKIVSLSYLEATQCFPFYTYDEDGSNRRENITDWSLKVFRSHYNDNKIEKWDIFYYIYAILHHPGYRKDFADCLKKELPRIPYAPDFWAFMEVGRKLADFHLNYEEVEPYPLKWIETESPLSFRVEKMRLSSDNKSIIVNPTLTLAGIPEETFDYKLGNKSALDWIIDQYQVKEDIETGIVSDPNNPEDEKYIANLAGRVVKVSIETMNIIKSLPEKYGD